ncbi:MULTISPECIES: DUF983 domain-containing protein [Sphingomonas]|uniref:DUF983 domain-containing protein n=1 Tax=Sphingomonas kyungheensis TaxID=1069987 RepID=A0ABU8H5C9_9SPHN|nr:DUF983 domain-containing protein [Sphingomonas sp. RIT328]EZP56123.1 hypothetical protein BW41_00767 [Sphingomonas sp. RIT328]
MTDPEPSGPVPSAPAQPGPVQPSIVQAALGGLCPRCGKPTLFAGMIRFADRCSACGLDFSRFNVGDGPAAFLTLILGTLVVIGAITLELTLHPPLWLHMLIWIPVTLAGVIWSLRLAKGALMSAEFRNAAREGRIDPRP